MGVGRRRGGGWGGGASPTPNGCGRPPGTLPWLRRHRRASRLPLMRRRVLIPLWMGLLGEVLDC